MPDGDPTVASVRRGNGLAAHSSLFMLLIALMRRTFVVEQPGTSLLMHTTRMAWLRETLANVGIPIFRQSFWLGSWGHSNPKRTTLWSNSYVVRVFSTPKLERSGFKDAPKLTVKYETKSGKTGYHGSDALKKTECPGPSYR